MSDASQPAAEQPAAEQPAAEQPAAEQPAAEQPAAEQPAAEQPAAEQPAAEQPAAEEVEYTDFRAPEGVELDKSLLGEVAPIFKELGLTKEQAQKLVDFQSAQVLKQMEHFEQMKQEWLEAAKTDKDIGGDRFNESVNDAKLFVSKLGTQGLMKLLNDTGVGNHPEIIKAFAHAGKLLKEDRPVGTGFNATEKKDRISILYGSN